MADEKVALDSNRESLIAEVEKRLDFNVRAYGTAWNGERGDTEFVLAPLLAELALLRTELEALARNTLTVVAMLERAS